MTGNFATGVLASVLISFCGTAATGLALAPAGAQDSGPLPGATAAQAATSPATPYANQSMLYPGEAFI